MKEEDYKKLNSLGEFIWDEAIIERLKNKKLHNTFGNEKNRNKKDELISKNIDFAERCEETLHWIKKILSGWEIMLGQIY